MTTSLLLSCKFFARVVPTLPPPKIAILVIVYMINWCVLPAIVTIVLYLWNYGTSERGEAKDSEMWLTEPVNRSSEQCPFVDALGKEDLLLTGFVRRFEELRNSSFECQTILYDSLLYFIKTDGHPDIIDIPLIDFFLDVFFL
jgi:hypothetical protein